MQSQPLVQEGDTTEINQINDTNLQQNVKKKPKRKFSKKKKNIQKLRMEQLSTVYSTNHQYTQSSQVSNRVQKMVINHSPRINSSQPLQKRNKIVNNLSPQQLSSDNYEISNLYSTCVVKQVSDLFQQNQYLSKSIRNFKIPQTMKQQIEQYKQKINYERQIQGESGQLQQNNNDLLKNKQTKQLYANLQLIASNTPSTSSDQHNKEDASDKFQLSPQSFMHIKEVDQNNKNLINLYTTDSFQGSETNRNISSTQKNIYTSIVNKRRSQSLNQDGSNQSKILQSRTLQANLKSSNLINEQNDPIRKQSETTPCNNVQYNNWEEQFIGVVQDDERDSNRQSTNESFHLNKSYSKKEDNKIKLLKFSMDNISFSNPEYLERLKKKLAFKPREFIPIGTKYSFQSQEQDHSSYFKSLSQTPKVSNFKTKQFNEGTRETSPNLQKKISRRFFDKYQNNYHHSASMNQSQDFDFQKIKEKTIQIKKYTQQLQYFPWRLSQIVQEKEKQEQERKMNRFEFESNNSSHKQPPQKQQQQLENRFNNLMQNMDMSKQIEEINRIINKQRQVIRKESDQQIHKTVRFINQDPLQPQSQEQ
ncbi:hypothetical protein TTHERM_00389730 (macronuclear) [Tetrahymena thermophila SB210]|uniref:Uncharacterized protein n=1 Tax=Tetrahymena thermophila (strain SB210) TaxID=312017 RepID=Q23RB5_TETTS|nr:hypothetical protein TTHERM_00389730 [Tetrahymena thermophila SB210]EAR99133.1 hypothetical protein TTHERM_00389730 [Tetrahymena thermophila SB210]|eukprot:XP_001019378.1 hypothetical protein TTHERM_00389730 [Tetrahymena thermophila SB210]